MLNAIYNMEVDLPDVAAYGPGKCFLFLFQALLIPAAALRLILHDHVIDKLELPGGIPGTMDELQSIRNMGWSQGNLPCIKGMLILKGSFFSLTSTRDLKHKDTIKVVHIVELNSINFHNDTELVLAACKEALLLSFQTFL